jgi:hypothetical protein
MPIVFSLTMNADGYHRGIRLFNAREFYDAHEVWEDVWRESEGMEKRFLQGLIQAAVAFHHHSTGNVDGTCSLLERACKNLAACPEEFGGDPNGRVAGVAGAVAGRAGVRQDDTRASRDRARRIRS